MKNSFDEPAGQQATPNDTAASVSQPQILQPRYVRLPKSGTLCPYCGLSRSQMYLLIKNGLVKSHSLRRRGTVRGCRLIDFDSLCAAIRTFESAEEQEKRAQ